MEACCSRFTPAEGGTRLAAAASSTNLLAVEYSSFISTRLIHEEAYKIRGSLFDGKQRSIYVSRASKIAYIAYELKILTDLTITQAKEYGEVYDWYAELETKEVLVCTSAVLKQILQEELLTMMNINVLIVDSCHLICTDDALKYIMQQYKTCDKEKRPRILALTYPLFNLNKKDNSIEHLKPVIDKIDSPIGKEQSTDKNHTEIEENEIERGPEEKYDEIPNSKTEQEIIEEKVEDKVQNKSIIKSTQCEEIGVFENLDDFDMYEKLEWKIEELEKELCCQMDLAEDIDGGKRLSSTTSKPRELIIEYKSQPPIEELPQAYIELDQFMRDTINDALTFLDDHSGTKEKRMKWCILSCNNYSARRSDAMDGITFHLYDPTEIYGDDLYDEIKNIPDPTIEPRHIFKQFLYVLDQLGPYAADKAAFTLLTKLDKLKLKIPYERHFLLLCLCVTVFVKIACHADNVFSKYEDNWEKIKLFTTPKVLRFAEILEKFDPPDCCKDTQKNHDKYANMTFNKNGIEKEVKSKTNLMLNAIETCDFEALGNKIEDKVNVLQANLKDIEDYSIDDYIKGKPTEEQDENIKNITQHTSPESFDEKTEVLPHKEKNEIETVNNVQDNLENKNTKHFENKKVEEIVQTHENTIEITRKTPENGKISEGTHKLTIRRPGHRTRGRGRLQRNNTTRAQQMQMNPDALCGIVFVKEPIMAKIMFMLIVDMSRANPKLSYLSTQYCAVETPADPGTELKECQRQGKKQEDVLKKFRMHECNLLLATPLLEEGIDLPRCNLVMRWDVPPSYRSYGLCRSRARANKAACILLCNGKLEHIEVLLHNVATYKELDQIISRKCGCGIQDEPPQIEEDDADMFTPLIRAYTPEKQIIKSTDKITENRSDLHKNESDPHDNNIDPLQNNSDSLKNNDSHENNRDSYENNYNIEYVTQEIKQLSIIDQNKLKIDKDNQNIDQTEEVNDLKEQKHDATAEDKTEQDIIIQNGDIILQSVVNTMQSICNDADNNDLCVHNKNQNDILINSDELSDLLNKNYVLNDCKQTQIDNKNRTKSEINYLDKSIPNKSELTVSCKKCKNKCVNTSCICEKEDRSKKNGDTDSVASVDLNSAIALINRYCGKLPSDTFTRLAPQWWMEEVQLPVRGSELKKTAYICTLKLPLNCPVKYNIVGHPMPTRVLARRMVALQACRILHKSGELDNQLMPIGKENFKAVDLESGCPNSGDQLDPNDLARPGTTKRRQYYFKRTAWAFTDCQPVVDTSDTEIDNTTEVKETKPKEIKKEGKRNMLYAIVSSLWCALPERYNTRGRRLHAPQLAQQAIGILMARHEPDSLQIPSFPVYTRSGEVRVSVEHVPDADVRMSPRRGRLVRRFMRFVFSEVLRVRRRGMKLQNEGSTYNNYYIVPTVKTINPDGSTKINIDWQFLELIYQHTEEKKLTGIEKPVLFPDDDEEEEESAVQDNVKTKDKEEVKKIDNPLLKPGEVFVFDAEKYKEAVVTPWYRNQDQPQYFLVAEICWNLSPESAFPSASHSSFRQYYLHKYGAELTQPAQPLLDVDHTSARLNLLTPRYVNRKGVALPVSSERTRRAKRDRLDQKQILVPELCRVHPFAAPLWFATVSLPCVLYRINALLIADEIRRAVAIDVGLGIPKIDENTCPGFSWPPLDFGWSLSEVLNMDLEKGDKKNEDSLEKSEYTEEKDSRMKSEQNEIDAEKTEQVKEKTINDILQEKEDAESGFEIGTWSNDMASSIPDTLEYDEFMEPLPPNLTLCTSASGGTNWCDPIDKPKSQYNPTRAYSMADSDCSYMSSDFDTDDTDMDSEGSDEDDDLGGFCRSKNSNAAMGVRIEYKTAHEAEAVDVERKAKRTPGPTRDVQDDEADTRMQYSLLRTGDAPAQYVENFRKAVIEHKKEIVDKGLLIKDDATIKEILPQSKEQKSIKYDEKMNVNELINELFPYGTEGANLIKNGQVNLEDIEKNKRILLAELKKSLSQEEIKKLNCFSMIDVDIDSPNYKNEKLSNVGFDSKDIYEKKLNFAQENKHMPYYTDNKGASGKDFDFDYQPSLEGHPGPSPSVILQALTMSNANDGINLERLETIGDSFLKFAITAYLYCAHPTVHEGKLSHMRSKQVSNLNLYRLGRSKRLGARMIASKFEPHDNWLPPCHRPPPTLHNKHNAEGEEQSPPVQEVPCDSTGCFIPYNLITQHSIPDKSIADCVEALIGAYLLECGPRGALLFMSWLGIKVLPVHLIELPDDHPYVVAEESRREGEKQKPQPHPSPKRERSLSESESSCSSDEEQEWRQQQEECPTPDVASSRRATVGSLTPRREGGRWVQPVFGELKAPPSPLLRYIEDPESELEQMLSGYEALERTLQYRFKDRSLLLQALTHASHHKNRLTDCYQRLEFLGDAILDYLITRHLYEDPRRHSPGALTDLRSALVNNTIFATLAARHGFHKYFRHMSPGLNEVLTKYVRIQEENGHSISEEHYLIQEDEMEQAEDVEVPKALGDLFESVAGAIFLDSGMSLGAVWRSYVNLMGAELEAFSAAAPKSPVRELLEAEPDTAKFGKPERLADGRRVRVCVEVFGRGSFKGVGRNYRIAKGTAARCALRHLKLHKPR